MRKPAHFSLISFPCCIKKSCVLTRFLAPQERGKRWAIIFRVSSDSLKAAILAACRKLASENEVALLLQKTLRVG